MRPSLLAAAVLTAATAGPAVGQLTSLTEGFEAVGAVPAAGWVNVNNSDPVGTLSWSNVTAAEAGHNAQGGPADSQFGVGFEAGVITPGGQISAWLITPHLSFATETRLTFWTRAATNAGGTVDFADRLQVRLSTAGTSTAVGSTATSVGDFTGLLLDVNPTYSLNDFPAGYPFAYREFVVDIPAQASSGRLAFRYLIANTNVQGSLITIDTLTFQPIPEPGLVLLVAAAGLAGVRRRLC
jgi:hypothetical protein